ncbi:tRNA lysidine(34) synthetase TilS [Anaerotalea alkaliphila]|uniref:tRNA(Ile)-lysidine synthase n=1 Tax=Anaerotalea alkaliphila TaxID=2662126 RepID=A0A7X5HTL0_9FIRM|nr:tRNA lysidine(34) synthetase TilS [Anaerotalea alkaliphila]NDL66427.1 tRNA lysidine(34) synthetase TilS [Anaerotalea alkaliphila]
MQNRVKETILKNGLIEQNQRVLVGVSGGADSMALLFVLWKLAAEGMGFTLGAVHVHHGIRGGEADGDEAHVASFCRKLGVPLAVRRVDVPGLAAREGLSLEEAGRKARYRAFQALVREEGWDRVAVAHHRDDQVETILLNLFRGTGLPGLAGMPLRRGNIIRPLLHCSRAEVEEWCESQGIGYRTDATNLEAVHTRNRIRLHLLPLVEREVNPHVREQLLGMAELLEEENRFLESEAEKALEAVAGPGGDLALEPLLALPLALRRRVVLAACAAAGGGRRDLGKVHVDAVLALAARPPGSRQLHLPGGLRARVRYGKLELGLEPSGPEFGPESGPVEAVPTREELEAGTELFFLGRRFGFRVLEYDDSMKIPKNLYTKWFDYDRINNDLRIRTRQTGDFIAVKKETGALGRKTLKAWCIDEKIPKEARDSIPLVAMDHQILWIVGHRMGEAARVESGTRRVLEISVFEEKSNE